MTTPDAAPFVRPAGPDDLAGLQAFDEWDIVTADRIADGHCFVAGPEDDVPRAYGILDRSFMSRRFAAVLFVHPDHRRRGLGRALLRHFESLVASDPPRDGKLWISTSLENLAMQRLLHERGYAHTGVISGLGRVPELFYCKVVTRDADDADDAAA